MVLLVRLTRIGGFDKMAWRMTRGLARERGTKSKLIVAGETGAEGTLVGSIWSLKLARILTATG